MLLLLHYIIYNYIHVCYYYYIFILYFYFIRNKNTVLEKKNSTHLSHRVLLWSWYSVGFVVSLWLLVSLCLVLVLMFQFYFDGLFFWIPVWFFLLEEQGSLFIISSASIYYIGHRQCHKHLLPWISTRATNVLFCCTKIIPKKWRIPHNNAQLWQYF